MDEIIRAAVGVCFVAVLGAAVFYLLFRAWVDEHRAERVTHASVRLSLSVETGLLTIRADGPRKSDRMHICAEDLSAGELISCIEELAEKVS